MLTADLRLLLVDLTDPDDCWFDHHGYCQAHVWLTSDVRCPHARAKDVLAAAKEAACGQCRSGEALDADIECDACGRVGAP